MESYKGSTVVVTGATGLIGKTLIRVLQAQGARIVAVVRDLARGRQLLGEDLRFIETDVTEIEAEDIGADYVIHGAANTSSLAFVEDPVSIINTAYQGTLRMLEFARVNQVKGFVLLSTMEVYGAPETDEKIREDHATNLNTMSVRSSYPESKRLCEALCAAYVKQYELPAKVVRLTQTFGPGVQYRDGRVFAEFARCVIEKRDIVLHTKGETRRCYLYTEDAARAILTVLANGKAGEAYNAANEETYCSIAEMAGMVAASCADSEIRVVIDAEDDGAKYGFAPVLRMNLDTEKLRNLGWNAETGLEEMFMRMIADMKAQCS